MTPKQEAALRQALENICAAKLCEFNSMSSRYEMIRLMDAAIAAIDEVLAEQPAQQPVAYMNPDDLEKMKRFGRGSVAWATPTDFCTQPVYTSQPARKPWVGMTDEEVDEWTPEIHSVIQAIEAKLREKNA